MLSLSGRSVIIVAVVGSGERVSRDVRARLIDRARARRLAQGTTAIADREVVTVECTVCAPAAPLTAPLSGRACVAYDAVATLYRSMVASGSRWVPLVRPTSNV